MKKMPEWMRFYDCHGWSLAKYAAGRLFAYTRKCECKFVQ